MGTTTNDEAGHDGNQHRPRPAARILAAVVVVAMAVGGVVLATRAGSTPDAAEVLEAAKSAFTDDVSYRFTFRTTEQLREGDPAGAGTETVTRTLTEGEVAAPNRWRIATTDSGGWQEESVRIDGTLYSRTVDEHDASSDDRWIEGEASALDELGVDDLVYELEWLDADDTAVAEGELGEADKAWRAAMRSSARLGIVATGHALDSAVDPARLTRLVRSADDAELVEERPDGLTLRATVAPPEALAEAIEEPLPSATVELDLDADDRPLAVRVELQENGAHLEVDLTFSDWGAPITVEAPADDRIDQTPLVDEDAVRTAEAALLVAPSVVPDGVELQSIKVAPGVDGCQIVTLDYWPPVDDGLSQQELDESLSEGPFLWVNVHREACEGTLGVGIDAPFDLQLGGLPARHDWGWEVRLGDVVVSLDSDADQATLDRVAASLAPTDAESLIAAAGG